jgi:hypothetical protein
MVTKEEFWNIMRSYGSLIWPAQIIFYLLAILLVGWVLIKPGKLPNFFAKLFLSIAFAWNGVLYFLTLAKGVAGNSNGNYINGFLFIIVACLFAIDLFREKMQFALPKLRWQKYVVLSLMLLVFCYPLIGLLLGYDFASLLVPGTHPCPTTALGLILLILALPYVNKTLFILLIFLAVPFTPFLQIAKYGIFEDTILFIVGLYGLFLLVKYWKPEIEKLSVEKHRLK